MAHQHHHHHSSSENIKVAFFLNLGFAILELFGGLAINSVAILSDALHDLGDSLSLGFAWGLDVYAKQDANRKYTYGYGRFSLLGALINSIVLIAGSIYILTESIPRLLAPEETNAQGMILFAVFGIAVNGFAAFRLKGEQSMNAKVVAWHLMEDVLGWIAVLIGGIVLLFVNLPIIDPILAILLTTYILFNVARNLKQTAALFLQRTPEEINLADIETELSTYDNVISSHDTHVWSLDGEHHVLTTHLVIEEEATKTEILRIKRDTKEWLMEKLHLSHITIEVEYPCEDCMMKTEEPELADPVNG